VNRQLVIAQRLVFVANSRTLLPDEPIFRPETAVERTAKIGAEKGGAAGLGMARALKTRKKGPASIGVFKGLRM
jgi:hypothetical protein